MPLRLHTIGHSTRPLAGFIDLLHENRCDMLIDVRTVPRSRTNPQYNAETLPDALAPAGIGYRHMKALGGLRGRAKGAPPSPNGAWRNDSFRNYADYALTPPFHDGLSALRALAETGACALMCAEAVWWRCHRRIITDYLLAGGADVVHIMGPGKTDTARLTAGAEPQADGTIRYPPAQPDLL